jgi:hypothetical protein
MAHMWGVVAGDELKPTYVKKTASKENVYATKKGWVHKRPDGTEEVLVSIRGLNTRLGAADPVAITWQTTPTTLVRNATATVRVSFNEKVTISGTPTLVITGSVSGAITASYTSTTSQGNTAIFTFTVPNTAQTLSIGAQSISLAGGTIYDISTVVASNLAISAPIASKPGTKVVA